MDLDSYDRYTSPIPPMIFPHLTIILLSFGIFFSGWFLVYEVTKQNSGASKSGKGLLFKELMTAAVAATFMGFGLTFLLLWVGIYI